MDLGKEDFIGKEALAKIKEEGVSHKLAGIRLGGKPINWYISDKYHVQDPSGELVGYVTSAWWSPTVQSNIALAMVPTDLAAIGTDLQVVLPDKWACETEGNVVPAVVSETPFKMPADSHKGTGLRQTGSKL